MNVLRTAALTKAEKILRQDEIALKSDYYSKSELDERFAKDDIPTVTNEDVFRLDFDNYEDQYDLHTNSQSFVFLLLKGFTIKGTKVLDNTSIDCKYVPKYNYENRIYTDPYFIESGSSYYFKNFDNSDTIYNKKDSILANDIRSEPP